MKKNNATKNKNVGRILSISDNPKFRQTAKIYLPQNESDENLIIFTLTSNAFGIAAGDLLICTTDFDTNEIQDKLVIARTGSGYRITANASIDNSSIYALIKFVQREL